MFSVHEMLCNAKPFSGSFLGHLFCWGNREIAPDDPLVNVYVTMENHNVQWTNPLCQATLHSYVNLPEGILSGFPISGG